MLPLLRACRAIAINEVPPNSMLIPTRRPSAHAAVPGSPVKMMKASNRSTMPLTIIQVQRPVSSFLCSSAYMIDATPSMVKNTISSKVSDMAPRIGQPNSIDPGDDAKDRRQQRPPEAGRVAHHEGGDQAYDAADEEQPAEQDRDRDRRNHRHQDGQHAEDDQNDALNEEQHPVFADGLGKRLLESIDAAGIHGHATPP